MPLFVYSRRHEHILFLIYDTQSLSCLQNLVLNSCLDVSLSLSMPESDVACWSWNTRSYLYQLAKKCHQWNAGTGQPHLIRKKQFAYVCRAPLLLLLLLFQQWIGKVWINLLRTPRVKCWVEKPHTAAATAGAAAILSRAARSIPFEPRRDGTTEFYENLPAFGLPLAGLGLRLGPLQFWHCGRLINDKSPKSFLFCHCQWLSIWLVDTSASAAAPAALLTGNTGKIT